MTEPSKRQRVETTESKDAVAANGSDNGEMLKLYSYWRSSCSFRVRIALAYKGLKYEYLPINLLKGEQKDDKYVALNPMKELPALVIDGVTLTQSGAILEYLEETRPENPLMPKDPKARAEVRALCDMIGCDIQPVQNLRVLLWAMELYEEDKKQEGKIAWGKRVVENGFEGLERALKKTASKYCYGDTLTLADAYLAPQMYNAARFKVDMSKYPTIARVAKNLEEHPAVKAAHPSVQPDAVVDA